MRRSLLLVNTMIAGDEKTYKLMMGKRIYYNGEFGTVVFIGEVPPTSGVWLGIEWDDPTRGKHDGLHEGVRYFKTKHPASGSFVRPLKADFGRSFLTALKDRYRQIKDDDMYGVDPNNLSQLQKEMKVRFIEMVGLDQVNKKQSCLLELKVAGLRNQKISEADPQGLILQVCPSIQELDLTKNLISKWETFAQISLELPRLHFVNLSENRIEVPEDPKSLANCFESLKHLVLGKVEYTWENILTCMEMWPNLCELQVPWNNMTSLSIPPTWVTIQSLDLEGNPINDWQEVNKLGLMHRLKVLNVSATGISKITLPGDEKTHLFPHLKRLILHENHISEDLDEGLSGSPPERPSSTAYAGKAPNLSSLSGSWGSVSELNKLQVLESLRINQNPVVEQFDNRTTRQLVIARIGKLSSLNGVEIHGDERKWSERDYIKEAATIRLRMKIPEEEFKRMHPRYSILVEKHGEPEEGELVLNETTTLSSALINLILCSPQRPDTVITKKLPKTMTVQRLKVLINKTLNFDDPKSFTLKLTNPKYPTMEIPLDNDQKSLDYFSATTGDRVIAEQISDR